VYNTSWSLKTYDSREKSLLRGAARDVLPRSVAERAKSPYPSTQDPAYTVRLQENARPYLSNPAHPVFELVSRDWLAKAVTAEAQITQASRRGLERALDLALWLDNVQAGPEIVIAMDTGTVDSRKRCSWSSRCTNCCAACGRRRTCRGPRDGRKRASGRTPAERRTGHTEDVTYSIKHRAVKSPKNRTTGRITPET
jgi:hypothetical protein